MNNIYQSLVSFMFMPTKSRYNTLQEKFIKSLSSTFSGETRKSIKNMLFVKNTYYLFPKKHATLLKWICL